MRPRLVWFAALLASAGIGGEAFAQEKGTLEPMRLPPLAHPEDPSTPAKQLFGRQVVPAALAARTIGFYSRGCLAGGQALPVNGPAWEVMRLSRNRNWGHPALLAFLERFAQKVPTVSHWPGILIGDMSQPRGGPMLTGHASHQIGLDADIWLTPMPNRD
ncbi:MAG TPA: penicillin-insensitive murein endopeptidase, partial [Methylocella sp.]|nr:penicillin-insensitive murein endopeptidase [Methylocella sp.]